jgi:hypothetical protein
MEDRREYRRLSVPLSLRMKLAGRDDQEQGIKVTSRNVSFEGFTIETEVFLENDVLLLQKGAEPIYLDPFLIAGDTVIEFNIKLPPDARIIAAHGKLAWYHLVSQGTSYYFKAGISLEGMASENGKRWIRFVTDMLQD